jgi:hypothetical protein
MPGGSPTLMLNTTSRRVIPSMNEALFREGKARLSVASIEPIFVQIPGGRLNVGCEWFDADSTKRVLAAPC